jgi:hypothetical protein
MSEHNVQAGERNGASMSDSTLHQSCSVRLKLEGEIVVKENRKIGTQN